jgi:hypothetical protein
MWLQQEEYEKFMVQENERKQQLVNKNKPKNSTKPSKPSPSVAQIFGLKMTDDYSQVT